MWVSFEFRRHVGETYQLCRKCQDKCQLGWDIGKHSERRIADKSASDTVDRFGIHG
jgi:hypothetical protein